MYESEVNNQWEDAGAIPAEVRRQWAGLGKEITARSMIPWGEHCTECGIPHCFLTCSLYQRRPFDMSCRRFTEGMVCVRGDWGIAPWLLKIEFKQWAKLWADGCTGLVPLQQANRYERVNAGLGAMIRLAPVPKRIKKSLAWRYRPHRTNFAMNIANETKPDYFLIEIYSPASANIAMTLCIRSRSVESNTPFTARFVVAPGLQRFCFPMATIRASVNLDERFYLEISPSASDARPLLYFGCMDFVRDPSYEAPTAVGGCKCVVWDLDQTVWNGVLIEDGPDRLTLKPGITETFKELDRRGILLSVASKNNPDDVMPVLRRFGLLDYILKPQVSWEPKGRGVRRIAQELNIGLDSLLYVDDSPFERAEVQAVCPEVKVIDAIDANWLLWREECQVVITAESSRRRLSYLEQDLRAEALAHSGDNYENFLRDCNIRIRVMPINEPLLPRVHELAQRTNQMNFSGTRYTQDQLASIVADKNLSSYAIEVDDRFGNYGIVGFAVMDHARGMLTDLAFSCRIQSKRIEHALLSHLLVRYPMRPFRAIWRKTERNAPAGKVFEDIGFHELRESDGVTELVFSEAEPPRYDFITLESDLLP
ncbi:MAG: HAD-IIIC family phosphatase [Verrucomicrobia bacterium]|nr:HAD-IIIC family phosphatase [Verrucomicrobiota bacterium]